MTETEMQQKRKNINAPLLVQIDADTKAMLQKRGYEEHQWNTLKTSLYKGAADQSIIMVLDYCKSRGLDPFKRPVHIVPIYDRNANNGNGGMVDTIWPSIAEVRTTAMRTGQYAGTDGATFGPDVELNLGGMVVVVPEWCQYTVYRVVGGTRCAFVGPKVYFAETYSKAGGKKGDQPNSMWAKRPRGQLDKCAEAAALRMAFPEEIGNEYIAEEAFGSNMKDVTPNTQKNAQESGSSIAEALSNGVQDNHSQAVDAEAAETDEPEQAAAPVAEDPDGYPYEDGMQPQQHG